MQLRIFREPTFFFLLIAALISVIYWTFNKNEKLLLPIDWQEVEARILVNELAQGFPATEQQRLEIEKNLVDDYILVMEAYDMGLQNDGRINDILAQKMRHVLSGNVIQPNEQELQSFYQQNLARYQQPARVTAAELVFDSADPLPEALLTQLENGAPDGELITELKNISGVLPQVTQDDLDSIFDEQLARQVFATTDSRWIGPYRSNRGQHWLQVEEFFPAQTPALGDIVDRVRLDWIALEEESLLQEEIERLREHYEVAFTNRP